MTDISGVGIDIHRSFYQVQVIDQDGVISGEPIPTGKEGESRLLDRLSDLAGPIVVAMEACTGAYHLYNLVKDKVGQVLIIDPTKLRERFPKKGKKTDKVDATNLARLARMQDTDSNWIPPEPTRRLREITNERCRVTEQSTMEMNRVHAKLKEYGFHWKGASKRLWTGEGRKWLSKTMLEAPEFIQLAINLSLERLDLLWKQKKALEVAICQEAMGSEEAKLLMTLPGVSAVGSAVILAEVGDWRRFDSAKQLASYAGLNPKVHQSANTCHYGSISRRGRKRLRWICVELALSAHQNCPQLKAFHERIKKRSRCHGKAKVATGRKLLTLCWHILRTGEPYRHEQAEKTARKFQRVGARIRGRACAKGAITR